MEQEVEEEKVEAENKEDEKEAVEKEATAKVMETIQAKADLSAKQEKFKSEEKSLNMAKPMVDGEKTFKVKMKAMEVERTLALAPVAAVPDPVPDQIKAAEVAKVKVAVKVIDTA